MPYETLAISTTAPVLSWANHELGSPEIKMAKNVASLPFVFKHVALMPDVHLVDTPRAEATGILRSTSQLAKTGLHQPM